VLLALRFATSLLIALWGVVVVVLGIGQGQIAWIPLGLVLLAVGLPMLAANPFATPLLYPTADRKAAR
jgi:hypothetical protein